METGIIREIDGRYLSASAVVQGAVTLGRGCNIWHQAVIRGDVAPITLGERVNIQDAVIIHCRTGVPSTVGDDVTMGHRAVFHGRSVGPRTLVGIGAVVLDDGRIGQDCLIGAGAVCPPGMRVPDGKVVLGMPARVVRDLEPAERDMIAEMVAHYLELAQAHAAGGFPPYA